MSDHPNDTVGNDNDKTPDSTSADEHSASKPVTIERVLEVLQDGHIDEEYGILRWSSNYAFLMSLTHEDVNLMAVYKPQMGERPLWDFPDGTLCYREVAAYLTSQELGWQIVPPTVLREGPRGIGSIQFYIDHNPEVNYFSLDESAYPQLMRMAAFDYVINNADRKGGHCLMDGQDHLWGIDHGIAFHAEHKLRTVIWDFAGQEIPDHLLKDLDTLCATLTDKDSAFQQALCGLISGPELKALNNRLRRLLNSRRYPRPGPGPNYPWPPV